MEEFNIRSKKLDRLTSLKRLLELGLNSIPELQPYIDKVNSIINTVNDGEISVVLLGSFSDGKTSAIAGLLGRLEDNMKIDNDESSDELTIYRPKDLKKGFKIVDTPGLFGTKEKEIDGKDIKFSQITERYISEAHIIIYVCDAVVPLKESHVEIIRRVMRDYHKLDNTIFVINKMDEAGYDLLDIDDFRRGSEIKKENLISRLRTTINLTPDEEKSLHIVCIAADPKGKGLAHWFSKMDGYYERSHIKDLRNCINTVIDKTDAESLSSSTFETSVEDVVDGLKKAIEGTTKPVNKALTKIKDSATDLEEDQRLLKKELASSKDELQNAINEIKSDILREIKGASLETIGDVISNHLGEQDGNITFYVFHKKINTLIEQCCETNAKAVDIAAVKLENDYSMQNEMLNEAVKFGISELKNLQVTGEQVKVIRDVIAKSYKFKPYGAINLGKNITKWAGWIGAGIGVAFELYGWYKQHENKKKLEELKQKLGNAINNCIAEIFNLFSSEDLYYKNFAPSYIELCKRVAERNKEVEDLQIKVKQLEQYKQHIEQWKNSGQYVKYEEI